MRLKILSLCIVIGLTLAYLIHNNLIEHQPATMHLYEKRWDIQLPNDYKQIYHFEGAHGFTGDGYRYTLFKYTNNSTYMVIDKLSKSTHYGDTRQYDIEAYIDEIITELVIDPKHRIHFNKPYKWQKLTKNSYDTLIILYLPEEKKVYFIETLI